MKKWLVMLSLVLLVGVLAACGGGETKETPKETGNEQQLSISATNFQFDKKEYTVKSGEPVKISYKTEQGVHGIEIQGAGVKLNDGESDIVTLDKGEYTIVCSIPCGEGHTQMVSKLIVT